MTFDISGGDAGADAVIKVIFDDTVDTEDVIIDLSDELMNAPAPDLTPEGWTSGQNFHLIEYSPAPGQIKANIIAQSKISAVYLNTESTSLTSQGWPATIDLTKANQAEIAILKSLGLNAIGIWKNPDVMGVIDFTDVFTHLGVSLGYEESEHKFSIQVKDRYGKLSEEYVFSVLSGAGHVNILSGVAEVGLKTIIAEIEYNGSCNLSDVTFEMRNLTGTFDKLTLTEVTPVAGQAGTYTVKLTSDKAILSSHTVRATFGSSTSDFDLVVKTPPFVIEASPNDAFAHSATITIDCEEADDAAVAQNLTFTLNGRVWENYTINGADVTFTRLRAGTKYTIEASNNDNSASAEITTETEDHLPGCDHGDTDDHSVGFGTSSWANPTKLGDYQYLWTTSTGWGTMNELTTSTYGSGSGNGFNTGGCSYKATSGTIPANGRSTQSFVNGGRAGTTTHADGHTTGNASLHKDKQNSGTNAALIRTVGWGSGNSAHGDANIFTDAKDNNAFGTCQNMTPGELYLGEYTDGPQYGIPFTSRPSGVSFYYHYDVTTSGNGDYGTAKIEVCDADGVTIAADSIKLEERSTYAKNPTSIYLDYKKGAKKAARIKIIFRSTDKYLENNPALKENKRYWNVPGDNNTSGGEYVGSELYIDDISLIY